MNFHYFFPASLIASLFVPFLVCSKNVYAELPQKNNPSITKQFTFSWPFSDEDKMRPRGGTTIGRPVTLLSGSSRQWETIQKAQTNKKEKDRLAILALAGDYRVSFDFIETMGFRPNYEVPAPYQSWGTERISVVVDQPDLLVLQHILEIHFADEKGESAEPIVIKHWRQDWRYEDEHSLDYQGKGLWRKTTRGKDSIKGKWSQSVYQVDDSPRYEGIGRWEHFPNMSVWNSDVLKRPLPRREFSVRDDYDFLESKIRITVISTGWIQEEDALKVSMSEGALKAIAIPVYLAREAGLSRYELITNFDFSKSDAYWKRTSIFWSLVRKVWEEIIAENTSFHLVSQRDGKYLFAELFNAAEKSQIEKEAQARTRIHSIINRYID